MRLCWLAVIALACVACYEPTAGHCSYSCAMHGDCPQGLKCDGTHCIEPGNATPCSMASSDASSDTLVVEYCDASDSFIIGCYPFEDDATDGSKYMADASATGIDYVAGRVGKAVSLGLGDKVDVADHIELDVAALTIEAWIHPVAFPTTRAGIVDTDQWGFFLHPGGELYCATSGNTTVNAGVMVDQWTHVACTFDGANMRIYVNGSVKDVRPEMGPLNTSAMSGLSIGADNPSGSGGNFVGYIDEVRILSRARSPQQICADAKLQACP